jgi:small-conductance mechanosensitive channel
MLPPVNLTAPRPSPPGTARAPSQGTPAKTGDTQDAADLPLDDTAESVPDGVASLAEEISKRAAILLLAQKRLEQEQGARLAKMHSEFNAAQEERSELMREADTLRDMAMEQMKKDDEILKKWISLI